MMNFSIVTVSRLIIVIFRSRLRLSVNVYGRIRIYERRYIGIVEGLQNQLVRKMKKMCFKIIPAAHL